MHEIIEKITTRHTIRCFQQRQIEDEVLEQILPIFAVKGFIRSADITGTDIQEMGRQHDVLCDHGRIVMTVLHV